MDPNAYFWQVQSGKLPVPAAAATLGIAIRHVDAEAGTIEVEFQARPEFADRPRPGRLPGRDARRHHGAGGGGDPRRWSEFAPTLNLNVSFARPARSGPIKGKGRVVRRGREVCLLAGELYQDGELVASGTATAIIRRM
jgi:hypothetical protein